MACTGDQGACALKTLSLMIAPRDLRHAGLVQAQGGSEHILPVLA